MRVCFFVFLLNYFYIHIHLLKLSMEFTMSPALVMLIHAGTCRQGDRSHPELRSSTLQSTSCALLSVHSNLIAALTLSQMQIYMLILVHKHTYFCLYIHTCMSCKCIQASPGPVARLITVLWVRVVPAQFSEVRSTFFPGIRQFSQKQLVLQS